ncbi:MAG: hypothetical protein LKJ25_01030 [Clostridia bacterium]|nr:hypothetical protein [Clostridia bacterium]
MPDISIRISAEDNYSTAVKHMGDSTKAFSKDADGLQQKIDALTNTKGNLKIETKNARKNLTDAQKVLENYDKTLSEMTETERKNTLANEEFAEQYGKAKENVMSANKVYEQAKTNMNLVGKEMRNTRKELDNLDKSYSRTSNRAEDKTILKAFAIQQISQEGQKLALSIGTAAGNSLLGTNGGNIFGNALSSAASLGSAGFAIGGPTGAAVGTTIGASMGAINGIVQNQQKKDDYFKSYVQSQYNDITNQLSEDVTNGSSIASNREQNLLVFENKLKGNIKAAEEFNNALIDIGRTPPFSYDSAATWSKTLLARGYNTKEVLNRINGFADMAAQLGLNDSGVSSIMNILDNASVSGEFTSRNLQMLYKNYGLNVYEPLEKKFNMTGNELADEIDKLPVDDVVNTIYNYIENGFKGASAKLADSYEGLKGQAESYEEDRNNAYGEGYNSKKEEDYRNQIAYEKGNNAYRIENANKYIGQYQASLENTKSALERQREAQVMASSEYKKAEAVNDGVTMGKLLAEAKVKSQNDYLKTDGYNALEKSEEELVDSIQRSSKDTYEIAGYTLGQKFTEGILNAINDFKDSESAILAIDKEQGYFTGGTETQNVQSTDSTYITLEGAKRRQTNKKAFGVPYVPRDNVPYILHQGERVLTASENREYKKGGDTIITGNNFVIREEADIPKVAAEIVHQTEIAAETAIRK